MILTKSLFPRFDLNKSVGQDMVIYEYIYIFKNNGKYFVCFRGGRFYFVGCNQEINHFLYLHAYNTNTCMSSLKAAATALVSCNIRKNYDDTTCLIHINQKKSCWKNIGSYFFLKYSWTTYFAVLYGTIACMILV